MPQMLVWQTQPALHFKKIQEEGKKTVVLESKYEDWTVGGISAEHMPQAEILINL